MAADARHRAATARARGSRCCAGSPSRNRASAREAAAAAPAFAALFSRASAARASSSVFQSSGHCAENGARDLSGVDVHDVADERRAGGIALAKNARPAAIGKAIGGGAELMLDHVAALLDHKHGLEPIREGARALLFQRPYEADLVDANAEGGGVARQ